MPRRLPILTCLALALVGLACERPSAPAEAPADVANTGTRPASTPPPREPEGLSGSHVVVAAGTRFYASADATEPVATRSYLEGEVDGTFEAEHVGWVMRRGEVSGSRVEVTPLEDASAADASVADRCGRGMKGLENFELSWWVERDSLLPVTAELAYLRFDDGSSIRLPAGTPILPAQTRPDPSGDGDHEQQLQLPVRVSAWGYELPLSSLDPAAMPATGLAFDPAPLPEPVSGGSLPRAGLRLAGERLDLAYFLAGGQSPPISTREHEGRMLVTIRGRCVEVEALADPSMSAALGYGTLAGRGGGGYGGGPPPNFFTVAAGATVRWPDGSVAGRTRAAARLYEDAAPGEGVCSYFSVGDGSRDLALCFAEADTQALELGTASVHELRRRPKADDPSRVSSTVTVFARHLRVPCVSHAVAANPELDVRLKAHVRFDEGKTPAEVKLRALAGDPSDELLACVREQLDAWKPVGQLGATLDFELRLGGRAARHD